jgi:membrane fusion protein (multidrug efflux system)
MNSDLTSFLRTALLVASAALVLQACGKAKPASTPAPPQVSVVTVHRSSVPITIELPGRTSAFLVAQVRARVDGIVLKREFKEGGDVKVGQRLYEIDPAPYIAILDNAKAALQKAQANLASTSALVERYKVLLPTNAISKQDYDNAVSMQGQAAADVATGKAMVETAQINLGYTNVVSPIVGRSGLSLVTQGAYVQLSAATLMTTVQQIDPIYVDLTQSSVEGLQLRSDIASGRLTVSGAHQAKVTLTLENGKQYPLPGALQFSDITVDQTTGSVTVRAIFPNPNFILLPGMFVRAHIEEGVSDDAILVPQVGVTHDPQGHATALVVGADGKVASRTLQLNGTHGDQWIVAGGLVDGDRVIVAGIQKVQPGVPVQATAVPQTAVAAASAPPTAAAPASASPATAAASSAAPTAAAAASASRSSGTVVSRK